MKINQKQAEVDVKTSERDMLVKKAEAVKQASAEAHEALETVKSDQKAKVCFLKVLPYSPLSNYGFRSENSKISRVGGSLFNRTRKLQSRESRYDYQRLITNGYYEAYHT